MNYDNYDNYAYYGLWHDLWLIHRFFQLQKLKATCITGQLLVGERGELAELEFHVLQQERPSWIGIQREMSCFLLWVDGLLLPGECENQNCPKYIIYCISVATQS